MIDIRSLAQIAQQLAMLNPNANPMATPPSAGLFKSPAIPMGNPAPPMTMGMEPAVPPMPIGVTPGQITSARSLGLMSADELEKQKDAETLAMTEAQKKASAPSTAKKPKKKSPDLPLAALLIAGILESIKPGAGQQGIQGYMSGQNMKLDKEFDNETDAYNTQVLGEDNERKAAALEAQLRGASLEEILGIQGGRAKAETDRINHLQDLEKIDATFKGRNELAGLNNDADFNQKILDVFKTASPELRAALSEHLKVSPEAAGAMKPSENLQTAKTEEIKLLLPHRIKKAMAEGDGAGLKNTLTEANTRLAKLRGDAEALKVKWLPAKLAAEVRKTNAAATKSSKEANEAAAGVIGKPATGTAILNAISKIDEADTQAEAAIAKLSHEAITLHTRIGDLRAGRDKSVSSGMVETEIKKVQEALEANEAVQEYYKVVRTRNAARRSQITSMGAATPPPPAGLPSSTDLAGGNQKKTVTFGT